VPLPLEALSEPEEGWAAAVEPCGFLDQSGRYAGRTLAPLGCAVREERLELGPAGRVRVDEGAVEQPVTGEDMEDGERECGVAPGEGLQVEVGRLGSRGAHGVDDDHPGR
jgi:hypothetical protein